MKITTELLDSLTEKARISERLRFAYDLRTTINDNSQRILNAMEPGTILPIHRHTKSSESCAVLRGVIRLNYYNDDGGYDRFFYIKSRILFSLCTESNWYMA